MGQDSPVVRAHSALAGGGELITHDACRSCGGDFMPVLDLGMHPLPDFGKKSPVWSYAPLNLVQCVDCLLVQLKHTVDREKLFSNYWYRSGMSETMRAALLEVARKAKPFLYDGAVSLDIGSNDGTLMSLMRGECVGFEPSSIGEGTDAIHDYFNAPRYFDLGIPSAEVITSIAMFYSVGEPEQFVSDIAAVLAADGVWINQMNDLTAMVENNAYDIIGHEHTCVWSLEALDPLLARHGLEVFRVERIDLNGGSIRIYAQHKGTRPVEASVLQQRAIEAKLNVARFGDHVREATAKLHDMARRIQRDGQRLYIYGASTRGVTIVHAAQLDEVLVSAAAERDESKVGMLFPGTRIPIVSERDAHIAAPDYFLALPYSYLPQFQKRESQWLKWGGRFIVPVPEPRVI